MGNDRPESSLMFAKFSPDGYKVAYVSEYNIYVEDLTSGKTGQLTTGGTRELINGTFDWAYEEEFFCRDGFRWSPDSKKIAYWQMDAKNTKNFLMLDNTDSIYPFVKPVVYPIAGEPPSPFKIGVVTISDAKTTWMSIPTDPVLQSYVPRMEWAANNNELIIQHLNRKQNTSDLMLCNVATGDSKIIYEEKDSAWIDILPFGMKIIIMADGTGSIMEKNFCGQLKKMAGGIYTGVSRDGKEKLITAGNYDVMKINAIDEKNNYIYFEASPENATQQYLYRTKLDGKGKAERVSPLNQNGTHEYDVSPQAKFAFHRFSNYYTPETNEWISLPDHSALDRHKVYHAIEKASSTKSNIEFFTIKTGDGISMDAWMVKPTNFDSTKKYPVLFYVYTEPWGQTVKDAFGTANNFLYNGNLADDGYLYISIDNRGTPVPKGRAWRKSVFHKIGLVNIRDQAMAAKEIFKKAYVDTSALQSGAGVVVGQPH